MKKVLFCLMVLAFTFSSINARANEVAVINLEEIIINSTSLNKVQKKLKAKKSDWEKKLKVEEKSLKNEGKALESQLKMLSQEVAREKVSTFQNKMLAFQNKVKESENELQKTYMNAYVEVTNNIKDIIVEMKNEKDSKYAFNLVLPKASTLYNNSDIDISREVLKRLNKRLKEIK